MRTFAFLLCLLTIVVVSGCRPPLDEPTAGPLVAPSDRPDILLITVDALRPDHLGTYGYERPTSPRIDGLAASAIVFERAIAHASYTAPSLSAILTGKRPLFVGEKHVPVPLAADNETIAEILSAAGYDTAAFVDNGLLNRLGGWDQGFDEFECLDKDEAAEITSRALVWLTKERNRPAFLWLHYLDPHAPYKTRWAYGALFGEETDTRLWITSGEVDDASVVWDEPTTRNAINLYDGEIRHLDDNLGRLLDFLGKRERADRTMILLTADHGEAFMEHGDKSHGYNVLEENVHVPLVIRPPGDRFKPRRVAQTIGTANLFSTVLDYAGVSPRAVRGRSLRPLIEGKDGWSPQPVISQAASGDFGIRDNKNNVVYRHRDETYYWYNLDSDPGEMKPVKFEEVPLLRRTRAKELRDKLRAYRHVWSESETAPDGEIDPATAEALRSLGYVRD